MQKKVDLHLHSCHSDGLNTPTELVQRAAEHGLVTIAIADHDSVDGIDEAFDTGIRCGIEIVPAVELSVQFKKYRDVHLLGYFLDHKDPLFNQKLRDFRAKRDQRGRLIIDRINDRLLEEKHEPLSVEGVLKRTEGALGRPHIARELVARGFARDMQDAFSRYLEPCNVPKQYFPLPDALAEIKRVKGIAVLAHPLSITDNRGILTSLIEEMVGLGLDGIEVFNNMCYKDDTDFLAGVAARFGLVVTGGSDYHGGDEAFGIGVLRSGISIPNSTVEALRQLHILRYSTR